MAEAAEKNRQPICISQNSLVWQDDSVFKLYYYCMNCACRQKAEICGKQLMPDNCSSHTERQRLNWAGLVIS